MISAFRHTALQSSASRGSGYDPSPYLPVMSGWIVDSAELSDRFLHDYRKTVADCIADEHYGRMTELARFVTLQSFHSKSNGGRWAKPETSRRFFEHPGG